MQIRVMSLISSETILPSHFHPFLVIFLIFLFFPSHRFRLPNCDAKSAAELPERGAAAAESNPGQWPT